MRLDEITLKSIDEVDIYLNIIYESLKISSSLIKSPNHNQMIKDYKETLLDPNNQETFSVWVLQSPENRKIFLELKRRLGIR